jgi:hypothetical protein
VEPNGLVLFGEEDLKPEKPELERQKQAKVSRACNPFWDVGYWIVVYHGCECICLFPSKS